MNNTAPIIPAPIPITRAAAAYHQGRLLHEIREAMRQLFVGKLTHLTAEESVARLSRQFKLEPEEISRWVREGGWNEERERGRVLRVARIQEVEEKLKALKTKDPNEHLRAAWHGMRDIEKSLKQTYGQDYGSVKSHCDAMTVWERVLKTEGEIRKRMGIPSGEII